jgi:hypothetical protein
LRELQDTFQGFHSDCKQLKSAGRLTGSLIGGKGNGRSEMHGKNTGEYRIKGTGQGIRIIFNFRELRYSS